MTAGHEIDRNASPREDLSEEALYWGCKRVDGNWNSGTKFASAATALGRWGQPLEVEWPYEPTRADGAAYSPPARPGKSWFRSGMRAIPVSPIDVRAQLDAGTPVLLGLIVFDSLFSPDAQGRIADPQTGAPTRGRHAVLAVGYQPDQVLIRNSWGISWGLGGYGWISESYVRTHAGDAWVINATTTAASSTTTSRAHKEGPGGTVYGTR